MIVYDLYDLYDLYCAKKWKLYRTGEYSMRLLSFSLSMLFNFQPALGWMT